ncbi:MAG TPA: TonB-dependent receptor [Bacteroidia bacterium]|nr:TonB-dependent receptor [Bacteroidia bacterium]
MLGFAQQTGIVKGVVKDGSTKETLPGATVQLCTNLAKGTATDIDGIYSLVLDTGYQKLVCTFVGLQSDTFIVYITNNSITEKNISLNPEGKILSTIVVSSGKFDQKIEELTVSMEVLKPKLITNKNTTSIETALEQVPGVSIIDNDPQIRGGSGFTFGVGSRVAVMIDGIPMLSGDAGRPEWNYMPVENLEQVEVIKGASSVLYGSSALNGVINLRTSYPRTTPKTVINYSAGDYSLPQSPADNWYGKSLPAFSNLNFYHSRIINNNLDLVVGGNFNIDQGYIGPPPPAKYIPMDIKVGVLKMDSNATIPTYTNQDMLKERGRINFNLRYRSKKIQGLNFGVNGNGMLNKTNMVLAWLNDSSGLYKGYPGAVFMQNQTIFNIDPFLRYTTSNGISHSLNTRVFHTDNVISNNQSNNGTSYYAEYQFQRKFKTIGLTFTGGLVNNLSYSYSKLYASEGTPNNHLHNIAGYAQFDKKFWDVLTLSGGFRYEYFKMNKQQDVVAPIFRGGANLQVLKATYVRVAYGQGFRYPTITERYIETKAGMFGVFPNPDLKPEQSQSFEAGVKQGFKIGNFSGFIDAVGFYQTYQNTIEFLFGVWDPNVSLVGFKFVNTGNSRVRGLDFSLGASTPETNKKFGATALIGYTYVDPVTLTPNYVYAHDSSKVLNPANNNALSYKRTSMDTTNHTLKYRYKHMVKADIEFKIYKFGLGFSYRYYSKMQNIDSAFASLEKATQVLSQYIYQIKGISFWQAHSGYSIFDARLNYRITPRQRISLICNNLFNVAYMLRPMKIEPPRTTSLQYIYEF